MTDKVAVVTGGGSGIGAATAIALARDGWWVVIVGRREQALNELADTYPDLRLVPIAADVTDEASVRALFSEDGEQARAGRPAVQQCRDGLAGPRRSLGSFHWTEWQAVVDLNLTGAFLCTREAFAIMRQQDPRGGRIINNGSISAHSPRPARSLIPRPSTRSPG